MNSVKPREIYYDIQINNFESTGTASLPLRFSETRTKPIVTNAGDYSLSIVRFQLDTYSLPTFIADIEPYPNTDIDKMIETITLEYDNGSLTTEGPLSLKWIATNVHTPKPNAPLPLQETGTEYYYGNSFRHYCDLMNNCLETLTTNLKVSVGAALDGLIAPKMLWNEQNSTVELIAQEEFFDESKTNHINIYFNRALYGKLTSLPAIKNYNGSDGKIYKIYMKNDYSTKLINITVDGVAGIPFIKTSQEYSTISNWCAVSSIVFTTNTLPIFATQLSEPLVYSNGLSLKTNIPQNFAQVISDMATNDLCYKPNLIYAPTAENRYIDMFGNNDISTLDINVYWKDQKGNLNPFYLQSGGSASIKVMFKLK
jgi:hypothetical protein